MVVAAVEIPIHRLRCSFQGGQLVAGTEEIPTDMSERDARQRLQPFGTTSKISFHIDQTGLPVNRPGPVGAFIQKFLLVGGQDRSLGFEKYEGLDVFHSSIYSLKNTSPLKVQKIVKPILQVGWNLDFILNFLG